MSSTQAEHHEHQFHAPSPTASISSQEGGSGTRSATKDVSSATVGPSALAIVRSCVQQAGVRVRVRVCVCVCVWRQRVRETSCRHEAPRAQSACACGAAAGRHCTQGSSPFHAKFHSQAAHPACSQTDSEGKSGRTCTMDAPSRMTSASGTGSRSCATPARMSALCTRARAGATSLSRREKACCHSRGGAYLRGRGRAGKRFTQ